MSHTKKTFVCFSLTMIIVLALSSCASPPQAMPTETVKPETATPQNTPTRVATSTRTAMPLPTATFTPNVTATQLPEITPAAEGKGNVIGLALWNGEPIPKAAVWLCEKFEGGCLGTYQYRTNSDKNGYYVFKNVVPGRYLVAINSFSTGWFVFYRGTSGTREQVVSADKNLILNPWNIWKFDLRIVSPRIGKTLSQATPTFTWDPYPDAAYYQFSLYDDQLDPVLEDKRVDGTEFTVGHSLVSCKYSWHVDAYSAEGIKIASTKRGDLFFYNIDVPGKC
jgi:hypothetical protein